MTEHCSRFQIVSLGDGRVGKTSILQRYMNEKFSEQYVETVEDIYSQLYTINGRRQNIDFIDTAGNISFPAMRQIYISKAHGFMLVYSISKKESFEAVKKLWDEIKIARKNILSIPCVIIGNNLDEENIRQVETFDALDWACSENLGGCFLEVSAKEDRFIHDIFKILFEQFGNRRSQQKGPQRLRSTSIGRIVSESNLLNSKKKHLFKRSKNVACVLDHPTDSSFLDMVFDDYKQSDICRLRFNNNSSGKLKSFEKSKSVESGVVSPEKLKSLENSKFGGSNSLSSSKPMPFVKSQSVDSSCLSSYSITKMKMSHSDTLFGEHANKQSFSVCANDSKSNVEFETKKQSFADRKGFPDESTISVKPKVKADRSFDDISSKRKVLQQQRTTECNIS